jgi:hypothetical protein
MSNAEEDHLDTDSALPDTASPPVAERRRPAWAMIAVLVALAIVAAVVIMTVIPNGGVMQ